MAEGPSPAKKGRRSAPVARVTAEERVRQFPDDFNADGEVLSANFAIIASTISSGHYKGPSQVKKASAEERLEGSGHFQQWKKTGNSNDIG